MTMLANAPSFSIKGNEKIANADLAYFENRLRNRFYDIVMEQFEKTKQESGLTQAALARRLGKRPEQINRWFSTPGNWTIETISHLLIGINGSELTLGVQGVGYRTGITIDGTTVQIGSAPAIVQIDQLATNNGHINPVVMNQPFASASYPSEPVRSGK